MRRARPGRNREKWTNWDEMEKPKLTERQVAIYSAATLGGPHAQHVDFHALSVDEIKALVDRWHAEDPIGTMKRAGLGPNSSPRSFRPKIAPKVAPRPIATETKVVKMVELGGIYRRPLNPKTWTMVYTHDCHCIEWRFLACSCDYNYASPGGVSMAV